MLILKSNDKSQSEARKAVDASNAHLVRRGDGCPESFLPSLPHLDASHEWL